MCVWKCVVWCWWWCESSVVADVELGTSGTEDEDAAREPTAERQVGEDKGKRRTIHNCIKVTTNITRTASANVRPIYSWYRRYCTVP